jgi:3-hydroxyisobutyrate dehydrogenase-like beta-hydroxyacid dehydrogenase
MTVQQPSIAVLGLGAMGRALARAFVTAGHPTNVWNRSAGRADPLVAAGAHEAATAAEAILAAQLTVMCLLDRSAVDAVADAIGTGWRGATVVNLTSSTPEDARAVAERLTHAGARYLDGTIMVPTNLIGTPASHVLYSGDASVFAEHEHTLSALGGTAELLGDDPGLAATYDLGMLDIFFNGMAGFLHAAALVGADGVRAGTFVPYAKRMLALLDDTIVGLADDVDRGEHDGSEDNLTMELSFLDHIVQTSLNRGLDISVPATPRALVHAAVSGGHGADSFSRIVDILRRPSVVAADTAPSAGFEPAHTAPEAVALSPELRGRRGTG